MTAFLARVTRAICRYAYDLAVSEPDWQDMAELDRALRAGATVIPTQRAGGDVVWAGPR